MKVSKRILKICNNGHRYYKSSDCNSCPVCEQVRKPEAGFLSNLVAPARRALENAGITTLEVLSAHTENQILALHGIGPSSIPKLREALSNVGLSFNEEGKTAN